jgi:hypothetical protein
MDGAAGELGAVGVLGPIGGSGLSRHMVVAAATMSTRISL